MLRSTRNRLVRTTCLTLTAALALAACSSSSDSDAESTDAAGGESDGLAVSDFSVMTRWTAGSNENDFLQGVLADFTERTGVDVEVVDGGEEIDVTFETAVAAGEEPDVVIVNLFDKSLGWLEQGVVEPMDDYLAEWDLEGSIDEVALQEWRVGQEADGELQGLPYSGFAWPVWYNTAILAEAGVDDIPQTTEDLKDAAAQLRDAGIDPMIVGGNDWSGQKLFYQIWQSYLAGDDAKQIMQEGGYCESPESMQGIDLFVELRDAGVFVDNVQGFTADDMNNTYYLAEAAMMPAGSWAFGGAVESDDEGGTTVVDDTVLGGFPLPDGASFSGPTTYSGFTGVGFMVTPKGASDDRIEATEQLIREFYAEENVAGFVTAANNVPPVQGDFSDAATNPLLAQAVSLDGTELAVLPDVWLGANSDPITQATGLAYGNAGSDEICQALDTATS